MKTVVLNGLEETELFGLRLASHLNPGDIVCLHGDLGAGKTTLTKSIGKGLGVKGLINSPTFTLINEYKGNLPVYHFDTYRLNDGIELFDLGFDEYFFSDGICIVEWPEKIEKLIPETAVHIYIERGDNADERIVSYDESRLEGI